MNKNLLRELVKFIIKVINAGKMFVIALPMGGEKQLIKRNLLASKIR